MCQIWIFLLRNQDFAAPKTAPNPFWAIALLCSAVWLRNGEWVLATKIGWFAAYRKTPALAKWIPTCNFPLNGWRQNSWCSELPVSASFIEDSCSYGVFDYSSIIKKLWGHLSTPCDIMMAKALVSNFWTCLLIIIILLPLHLFLLFSVTWLSMYLCCIAKWRGHIVGTYYAILT